MHKQRSCRTSFCSFPTQKKKEEEISISSSFIVMDEYSTPKEETEEISLSSSFIATEMNADLLADDGNTVAVKQHNDGPV